MKVHELPTPALVVDLAVLDHNIDTMAAARPGPALRPHVKAFKCTELARHVADRGGHRAFCCATMREMEGMAAAGLGGDLLLANETLDAPRLTALVDRGDARITVAGHTDDLPISNGRFRDNWDLSSARAASVIRELVIRHGIDPARLEAKGHADTRPLTRNGSAKDRARNRRIEIEIAWQR